MKGNNIQAAAPEEAATTTVSKAAASSKLIESGPANAIAIENGNINAKPNVNNADSKANEKTDTNDNEDSMAKVKANDNADSKPKPNDNTDSKPKPNDTKDSNAKPNENNNLYAKANENNNNVKANKNADSNLDYKPVQFPPPLAIFMPSTEKDSDALFSGGGISFTTGSQSGKFSYGFSSFKGKRPSMEDFFETQISEVNGQMVAFFGVFDGHGGSKTAEYLKNNLFQNLTSHPDFVKDTKTAIVEVFKQTDADYINDEKSQNKDAGSTASTALLLGDRLFVANVGDSRVVAGRAGSAVPLSNDHKPDRSDERERIEQAGGFIIWAGTWRVGGVLAVSRAFGDKLLKPFVVAEPEIQEEEIDSVDFIILASDGLWNVISNKEAVALVQDIKEAEEASRKLITEAYARGSTDNITCVVVRFDIS